MTAIAEPRAGRKRSHGNHRMRQIAIFTGGLLMALALAGCANLNRTEQRMVSGAAVGGIVAGPLGAGVGIGCVVETFE